MDQYHQKDISWFEHLKKFIDSGVEAFKQDPAYVVNDHPDRLYANGMTDAEAHNIYSTVLAKQIHESYKEYIISIHMRCPRLTLVRQMIECIEVFKDGTLLIHFGGGYEIEEHI